MLRMTSRGCVGRAVGGWRPVFRSLGGARATATVIAAEVFACLRSAVLATHAVQDRTGD